VAQFVEVGFRSSLRVRLNQWHTTLLPAPALRLAVSQLSALDRTPSASS
jgi:hypothetical protein